MPQVSPDLSLAAELWCGAVDAKRRGITIFNPCWLYVSWCHLVELRLEVSKLFLLAPYFAQRQPAHASNE